MSELQNRCKKARELISNDAHLIDVRTEQEFLSGSLSGAVNIPINVLSQITSLLDKKTPIVVYCGTGARSKSAHDLLHTHGFNRIYDLGALDTLQYC